MEAGSSTGATLKLPVESEPTEQPTKSTEQPFEPPSPEAINGVEGWLPLHNPANAVMVVLQPHGFIVVVVQQDRLPKRDAVLNPTARARAERQWEAELEGLCVGDVNFQGSLEPCIGCC